MNRAAKFQSSKPAQLRALIHELLVKDCDHLREREYDTAAFLDIGANIGVFSLAARHYFPHARIVAIEAHPLNFQRLQANLAGLNVEAHNLALGDGRPLYCVDGFEGSGHSKFRPQGEGVEVKSRPLLAFLRRFGIGGSGTFLKINCEGGEWSLLEGPDVEANKQALGAVDTMVMELHYAYKGDSRPGHSFSHFVEFFKGVRGAALEPQSPYGYSLVRSGLHPE